MCIGRNQCSSSEQDCLNESYGSAKRNRISLQTHKTDWEELALSTRCGRCSARRTNAAISGTPKNSSAPENAKSTDSQNPSVPTNVARALDFGCGLGRLTRALLDHYTEAHGVDISATMIEALSELTPRCHFHLNNSQDLSLFSKQTFDLVYTNRVLQHMPCPAMIEKYISEFFRITVPGGFVVFQVPYKKSHRNFIQLEAVWFPSSEVSGRPVRNPILTA